MDPHPTDPLPPVEPTAERRFGWGLALGLLMLLIAGVGGLAGWVIALRNEEATTVTQTIAATTGQGATGEVEVPDVVGLSEDEAIVRLADAGLDPQRRSARERRPRRVPGAGREGRCSGEAGGDVAAAGLDRADQRLERAGRVGRQAAA